MKIFSAEQIKQIDEFTIANEPIASIDLMEHAAMACTKRIMKLVNIDAELLIFCGKGNNGSDGFAIARLLLERGFNCSAFVINYTEKFSADAEINFTKLKETFGTKIFEINSLEDLKEKITHKNYIIVDALLGIGVNKPIDGLWKEAVNFINANFNRIVSIDIPSGLFPDDSSKENETIIHSSLTLTFQFPKLAFLVSVADWAGVAAPLASGLLALASAICSRDLRAGNRTLEAMGLAALDRAGMRRLLHSGRA